MPKQANTCTHTQYTPRDAGGEAGTIPTNDFVVCKADRSPPVSVDVEPKLLSPARDYFQSIVNAIM